jgi:hypothetical protein
MGRLAEIIEADWTPPPGVHACVTTRSGGVSLPPFDSLNLATHVGDDPSAVAENRARLRALLTLPSEPLWLNQVHGVAVADERTATSCSDECATADASYTDQPGVVLAVLTADCLSVAFASADGRELAVAHAGWRGLAAGVLESTLARFKAPPESIQAWIGPSIGPRHFEVGAEVRSEFVASLPAAETAFVPTGVPGKYLADLPALARQRLARAGLAQIGGGDLCTVSLSDRFYSYRRDGGRTGRMATLIWRDVD